MSTADIRRMDRHVIRDDFVDRFRINDFGQMIGDLGKGQETFLLAEGDQGLDLGLLVRRSTHLCACLKRPSAFVTFVFLFFWRFCRDSCACACSRL